MLKWNYESSSKSSSGYEDIVDKLKTYTKDSYISLPQEKREEVQEEILKLYRSKDIFPITYFNEQGILEEIQKCIDKEVKLEGDVLDLKLNQGSALLKFLFPNIATIIFGRDKRTMYSKFYDDHNLKRGIDFCLRYKKSVSPSEVRGGLEMIGGGVYGDFKTMNAKALYEKYCPENGIIYDFACGFGGRMLGALSSKNNYKYFGTEPCEETYTHLQELGGYIEKVTGKTNSYKVFKCGSEDLNLGRKDFVDFAFSSPPYFDLEVYSDEETQCYNKYPTLDEWFEGYVTKTIQNIYDMLKPNAVYGVNIADFKVQSKEVKFVDKWIEISEKIGFKFQEQIYMKLNLRANAGYREQWQEKEKKEGIFIFRK